MRMTRRSFLIHVTSTSAVVALGSGWPLTWAAESKPKMDGPANPFLRGNFAPVHEEITADNLTVIGQLPSEMDGMYVRVPYGFHGAWISGEMLAKQGE